MKIGHLQVIIWHILKERIFRFFRDTHRGWRINLLWWNEKQKALLDTLSDKMLNTLGIKAIIKFVSPKSIERFDGKSKRVIDLRNIEWIKRIVIESN